MEVIPKEEFLDLEIRILTDIAYRYGRYLQVSKERTSQSSQSDISALWRWHPRFPVRPTFTATSRNPALC